MDWRPNSSQIWRPFPYPSSNSRTSSDTQSGRVPIESRPLPYLFGYGGQQTGLTQPGAPTVTIDAAAGGYAAVPVRAGKAGVNRKLIDLADEAVPPEAVEIVISFGIVPELRLPQSFPL